MTPPPSPEPAPVTDANIEWPRLSDPRYARRAVTDLLADRGRAQERIGELEMRLRDRSIEVHRLLEHGIRLGMIGHYDRPWEECPVKPCGGDRALLGEEVPDGK